MEPILLMFLDHTQRRTTVGRTPLDERSARRRDLYLTTRDTHNRQISMPPVGFEPTISAGERPQAAPLLRSWVRIPPGAWIFVGCECRVLSGRGLCDEPIARPEEFYRLWCVVVCDLETSRICAPYMYDISSLRVNNVFLKETPCSFVEGIATFTVTAEFTWHILNLHIFTSFNLFVPQPKEFLRRQTVLQTESLYELQPLKARIKSHLLFAGIIRSSQFSPR